MNELQGIMLVVLLLFWIPSIVVIIDKYQYVKSSDVVIGKVIDIKPIYRSAKYTFEIMYNDIIENTTKTPNTQFQTYRMEEEVELYRNQTSELIRYRVKASFYVLPVVAMVASGMLFLFSLGA